ncbi:hypothetical protein [Nocardia wallacei]|nr:hypothetical protein [Nocardia wallacei]
MTEAPTIPVVRTVTEAAAWQPDPRITATVASSPGQVCDYGVSR